MQDTNGKLICSRQKFCVSDSFKAIQDNIIEGCDVGQYIIQLVTRTVSIHGVVRLTVGTSQNLQVVALNEQLI